MGGWRKLYSETCAPRQILLGRLNSGWREEQNN